MLHPSELQDFLSEQTLQSLLDFTSYLWRFCHPHAFHFWRKRQATLCETTHLLTKHKCMFRMYEIVFSLAFFVLHFTVLPSIFLYLLYSTNSVSYKTEMIIFSQYILVTKDHQKKKKKIYQLIKICKIYISRKAYIYIYIFKFM